MFLSFFLTFPLTLALDRRLLVWMISRSLILLLDLGLNEIQEPKPALTQCVFFVFSTEANGTHRAPSQIWQVLAHEELTLDQCHG